MTSKGLCLLGHIFKYIFFFYACLEVKSKFCHVIEKRALITEFVLAIPSTLFICSFNFGKTVTILMKY